MDSVIVNKLGKWLETNPRAEPEAEGLLREEFVRLFPKDRLGTLTLEQYCLGHANSRESFCYWLEYKTKDLGSIRGRGVEKHGVWYSKKDSDWRHPSQYDSPESAISR